MNNSLKNSMRDLYLQERGRYDAQRLQRDAGSGVERQGKLVCARVKSAVFNDVTKRASMINNI